MTRRELLVFSTASTLGLVQSRSFAQVPKVAAQTLLDRLSKKLAAAQYTEEASPGYAGMPVNYLVVGLLSVASAQNKLGYAASAKSTWVTAKEKAKILLSAGQPSHLAEVAIVGMKLGFLVEAKLLLNAIEQIWKEKKAPEERFVWSIYLSRIQNALPDKTTGKALAKKTLTTCLADVETIFQLATKGEMLIGISHEMARLGDADTAVPLFLRGINTRQKADSKLATETVMAFAEPILRAVGKQAPTKATPITQVLEEMIATTTDLSLVCRFARLQYEIGDKDGANATLEKGFSLVRERDKSVWVDQKLMIALALADVGNVDKATQIAKALYEAQPMTVQAIVEQDPPPLGRPSFRKSKLPAFSFIETWPGIGAARIYFHIGDFSRGIEIINQLKPLLSESPERMQIPDTNQMIRRTIRQGIYAALTTGNQEALARLEKMVPELQIDADKVLRSAFSGDSGRSPLDRKILLAYAMKGISHNTAAGHPMFLALLWATLGKGVAKKGEPEVANNWFDKAINVVPTNFVGLPMSPFEYPLADLDYVNPITAIAEALSEKY